MSVQNTGVHPAPSLAPYFGVRAFAYAVSNHAIAGLECIRHAQAEPSNLTMQEGEASIARKQQQPNQGRASCSLLANTRRLTQQAPYSVSKIENRNTAMKKIVLIALFALATLPGSVAASAMPNVEMAAPEMRISEVLERAAEELGLCYGQMCDGYLSGDVTVEREGDIYRVTMQEDGGGVIIHILDDF